MFCQDLNDRDWLSHVLELLRAEVLELELASHAAGGFFADDDHSALREGGDAGSEIHDRSDGGIDPAGGAGAFYLGRPDEGWSRMDANVDGNCFRR